MLALAILVSIRRRDEVFRIQPDQVRHSRNLADPGVTVTARAAGRRCPAGADWVGRCGSDPGRCCRRRLCRIEARVIGRHLDERIVGQELDGVGHHVLAPGSSLVGAQLEVQINRPLAGKMRYALRRADPEPAVATGTRGVGQALAFGDVLRCRIRGAEIVGRARPDGLLCLSRAGRPQSGAHEPRDQDQGRCENCSQSSCHCRLLESFIRTGCT